MSSQIFLSMSLQSSLMNKCYETPILRESKLRRQMMNCDDNGDDRQIDSGTKF
jgi:hypothetical protein